MWAVLRSKSSCFSSSSSSSSSSLLQQWKLGFLSLSHNLSASAAISNNAGLLELQEVEKILSDVRADNVKVFPGNKHCDWADFMVIATGRSTWHVRNIAQALVYKVKQKQKGAKRLVLPSVEGEEGGKWIVIDSGKVVIHALDEKAREYYNLENLWTTDTSEKEPTQDWHGSSASPFDACAVALIHFWNVNKGKKGGMLPLCRGFISGIAAVRFLSAVRPC